MDADDIVSFSYLPISVPTEPCENPRDLSPLDVSSICKKILMDDAQAAHEVHGVSPVLDGGEDDCMGLSRHQHTRHMVVRRLCLTNVRCVAGMRWSISVDDRSACGRFLFRIQAAESSDSIMQCSTRTTDRADRGCDFARVPRKRGSLEWCAQIWGFSPPYS